MVISPLTALMMDQKTNLSLKGLTVEYYGEGHEDCLDVIMKGKVQLVFLSPESLLRNERIRRMLLSSVYTNNLAGFVVDEAHCVRMW